MNYTGISSCRTGGSVQSAEVFSQRGGPVRRSSPVRKLASTILKSIHKVLPRGKPRGNTFTPQCNQMQRDKVHDNRLPEF